jgi:hypothetical protein
MRLFGLIAVIDIARSAIEFIVLQSVRPEPVEGSWFAKVSLHPLTCGLAQGSRLVNFFENTRDRAHHNPTLSPRAFQKNFRSNHPTLSASQGAG